MANSPYVGPNSHYEGPNSHYEGPYPNIGDLVLIHWDTNMGPTAMAIFLGDKDDSGYPFFFPFDDEWITDMKMSGYIPYFRGSLSRVIKILSSINEAQG